MTNRASATGTTFGSVLFRQASEDLQVELEAGRVSASDLYAMLEFMRDRAATIGETAAELVAAEGVHAVTVWTVAAKTAFRVRCEALFAAVLMEWKKQAPEGKRQFNTVAKKTVPIACLSVIFPEDLPLSADDDAMVRRVFESVAKLAGLRQFDVADYEDRLAA